MRISMRYIASAILLIISLVMPLACDAARLSDAVGQLAVADAQLPSDTGGDERHCPDCPLAHHCESDCCSNFAPMFQSAVPDYSPMPGYLHFFSINRKPPQIYFSIFVPPQNLAA